MGEIQDAKTVGLGEEWTHATNAIGHIEYAVRRGLGGAVVRQALDDAATDLAIFVDNADEKDLATRTAIWRRRVRLLVNASGEDIDEAALEALYGDVASAQVRNASTRQATGVTVSKRADGHFALKSAGGATLMTLPPFAGEAVRGNPQKYAAQIQLLDATAHTDDPEALRRHAMNVFSNVHEREYEALERRLLYQPTEARAGAFVNGATKIRMAKTPAEKAEAEAILRTALFAEAAPAKRLAYLGLDIFTLVGNLNSAIGLKQETAAAYKDLSEGRYLDGAMHTVWSAVELLGTVTGLRAGKLIREAAKTTPIGRRVVAARDLAKKMAAAQRKQTSVPAEVIVGRRQWARMNEDQRAYFKGVVNNAEGQVGEAHMTQVLTDVGANSFKRQEAINTSQGIPKTKAKDNPTRIEVIDKKKGGMRVFDDAAVGETIETFMGFFARPKTTPGKTTLFEHKAAGAGKTKSQLELEDKMKENQIKLGHLDIIDLHTPYSELNKGALKDTMKRLMTDPRLQGQKYVTSGVYKKNKNHPSDRGRHVKWDESELDKMLKSTERSLEIQKWGDRLPTAGDFMLGFAARLSAATDGDPAASSVRKRREPMSNDLDSNPQFND